jgi:cytochrome P450
VAFGFGPHQCLGQHLARTELDEVLNGLFPLRPVTPDLRTYDASVIYGVESLPVTW